MKLIGAKFIAQAQLFQFYSLDKLRFYKNTPLAFTAKFLIQHWQQNQR